MTFKNWVHKKLLLFYHKFCPISICYDDDSTTEKKDYHKNVENNNNNRDNENKQTK